ncbi:hsp90 co-chaperone Cdc37 [Basidiobolus ranarum]
MSTLNYSKWDNLEISDDEDFECHPNVDKSSFIRWRQAEIHRQRQERQDNLTALRSENSMNKELLSRLSDLSEKLDTEGILYFAQLLLKLEQNRTDSNKETPSYDDMLLVLLGQIMEEVKQYSNPEKEKHIKEKVKFHLGKLSEVDQKCVKELEKLEQEDKKKLTSENVCHTAFDKTIISKPKPTEPVEKTKVKTIEVLNPEINKNPNSSEIKTSTLDEEEDDEYEEVEASDALIEFGLQTDYSKSYELIKADPTLVSEAHADELMAEAFKYQLSDFSNEARAFVHQSLVLQYCVKLGSDGIGLFFHR